MAQQTILKSVKYKWINTTNASKKELTSIQKKYNLNQLDIDDSYPAKKAQRPKISFRSDYIFIVLLFPYYDKKNAELRPSEIDIFLTKDTIITIHRNKIKPLKDFFNKCQADRDFRKKALNKSPDILLYHIFDLIYQNIFPMLDHISLDLNNLEKMIFAGNKKGTVEQIFILKRNIVSFKTTMQVHKNIIRKFMHHNKLFTDNQNQLNVLFNDLVDYTKNIWDALEGYHLTINDLEKSYNSLATDKINTIMKTLTIFSVIVLPLTFICAIFTMDVSWMPIRDSYLDWHKIVGIQIIAIILMLLFFKRKKWL